jgi:hypothetical protein
MFTLERCTLQQRVQRVNMILDSVLRYAAIVLCIDGDAADAAVDRDEMGSHGAAPTFFFHSTSLALNIVPTRCSSQHAVHLNTLFISTSPQHHLDTDIHLSQYQPPAVFPVEHSFKR